MTVPLNHYLFFSSILFYIGLMGVISRRNTIIILLSIEIMLNASNLAFVAFSRFHGNLSGQACVFFIMVVAAAEVTVGLALAVALFRCKGTINADEANALKG